MMHELFTRLTKAAAGFALAWCFALGSGCAVPAESPDVGQPSAAQPETQEASRSSDAEKDEASAASSSAKRTDFVLMLRKDEPLTWDASTAYLVGNQGASGLWGTCGECAIATTLNLVTGSTYTEADIVDYVLGEGLCETSSGGMSANQLVAAYKGLLPSDSMDARLSIDDDAPTIEGMAELLERGVMLNVSVYGEMMREGGHTGEGEIFSTHWIVAYAADRAADGSVAGFWIIDSASDISYLTADQLAQIYYGHDGTTIIDPLCVEVYGYSLVKLLTI